ncbi:hypothetical protein [Limosilactobacillus vaginalis]|uniref:hypothetical protein n=1 Tax=Limosilactobacillus vaginalis TaxID=1633 RepID=UPI0024B8BA37|nr:hypothetical protein [Limosilactobacillus vaginalis]
MSEFKLPHVEDLTTNSKLPGQLTEDMKAIEQEDTDLRKLINDKHDDLSKQLTQLNQRLDELMNGGAM